MRLSHWPSSVVMDMVSVWLSGFGQPGNKSSLYLHPDLSETYATVMNDTLLFTHDRQRVSCHVGFTQSQWSNVCVRAVLYPFLRFELRNGGVEREMDSHTEQLPCAPPWSSGRN